MIVADTSGVLSAIDAAQRHHQAAAAVLGAEDQPAVLSPFVLAEVAAGAYWLAPFDAADVEAAAAVVERYRDQNVGLADASVVVLAARHRTNRILSLDERHFRVLRPLRRFRSYKLLPVDR